jgi:hypothetical protein
MVFIASSKKLSGLVTNIPAHTLRRLANPGYTTAQRRQCVMRATPSLGYATQIQLIHYQATESVDRAGPPVLTARP